MAARPFPPDTAVRRGIDILKQTSTKADDLRVGRGLGSTVAAFISREGAMADKPERSRPAADVVPPLVVPSGALEYRRFWRNSGGARSPQQASMNSWEKRQDWWHSAWRPLFCKVLEYLPENGRLLVRAGVGWQDNVVGVVSQSGPI